MQKLHEQLEESTQTIIYLQVKNEELSNQVNLYASERSDFEERIKELTAQHDLDLMKLEKAQAKANIGHRP